MFEFSQADISAQVAALPVAFQIWFQWMFVCIVLAPAFFVRHKQGRIAIVFSVIFLLVQFPLIRIVGLSNLLSLTHLLIWGPLVVYLCKELRANRIIRPSLFGVWAATAVATAVISLVFDVRDFGWWVAGERGVVTPAAEPVAPWFWIVLIVVSLAASMYYIYGGSSHTKRL